MRINQFYIVLLFYCFLPFNPPVSAQVFTLSAVDSLKQVVQAKTTSDSHRVMILHEISWVFVNKDNDKARVYADSAYALGHKINFDDGIRRSAHILANLDYMNSNYEGAGNYAKEARELALKDGQKTNIARHNSILSNVYNKTGRKAEALALNKEAMELAIEIKDTVTTISSQFNYSLKLRDAGETKEAARLLVRLLDYPLSFYQGTLILEQVCDAYLSRDMVEKGLPYCYQAVRIADFERNKAGYYQIHQLLGEHFYEKSQLDSARRYFQIILATRTKETDYAQALISVANVDMDEGYLNKAWEKTLEAISIYDKFQRPDLKLSAIFLRANLNAKKGNLNQALQDYDTALSLQPEDKDAAKILERSIRIRMRANQYVPEDHFVRYNRIRDSLQVIALDNSATKVIEEFENYRLRDKELILRQEAQVNKLTLERQKYALFLALFSALALLGAYLFQRRGRRRETELNNRLTVKNEEINIQNSQISRLNQEINHRATNNLRNVKLLLKDQQKRALSTGLDGSEVKELERKILAYTKLQEKLDTNLIKVNLANYLEDFCEHLRAAFSTNDKPVNFNHNIADVNVSPDFAAPLALIINELATNSLKYSRREDGILSISLDAVMDEDGELRVYYRDGGPADGPINPEAFSSGQGMELVKEFTEQLEGHIMGYGEKTDFSYEAVFELAA